MTAAQSSEAPRFASQWLGIWFSQLLLSISAASTGVSRGEVTCECREKDAAPQGIRAATVCFICGLMLTQLKFGSGYMFRETYGRKYIPNPRVTRGQYLWRILPLYVSITQLLRRKLHCIQPHSSTRFCLSDASFFISLTALSLSLQFSPTCWKEQTFKSWLKPMSMKPSDRCR